MLFDHENNEKSIHNIMKNNDLFTEKQGQYLAFIYYYTKINGQPPAETDMQRYFKVTAPSVHRMIVELEKNGLISKEKGKARSIEIRLNKEHLPRLT
jgi:Mn-dependent DtxR family transcriptional regulator